MSVAAAQTRPGTDVVHPHWCDPEFCTVAEDGEHITHDTGYYEIDPEYIAGRLGFGDTPALAASIGEVGLLQPIVTTTDGRLVAGERRLRAVRSLGWDRVPTHVVANLADASAVLKAERDENTCRKAMTPTEEASIYAALLEIEQAAARERQGERTDLAATSAEVRQKSAPQRAKSEAAKALGGSPRRYETLDKVLEVKAAAEAPETPEPVRTEAKAALAEIDSTGRVDGAYRRVKEAEQAVQRKPLEDFLAGDPKLADLGYVKSFLSALSPSMRLLQFDAERVGDLIDEDTFYLTAAADYAESCVKVAVS